MNNVNNVNNSNLAFKSRIVFLSPNGISKIHSKYKKKNFSYIFHYDISPKEYDSYNCYRQNVDVGYTQGVKTCTAGICANKGKKAPLFWHVENKVSNMEKFPLLARLVKGTNAIIIGSKKDYKLSCALFDRFIKQTESKNIPATIIKGTKTSEVSMLYESKKDTLYVCMQDIYKKDKYVKSAEDLQNNCDVVKISPTDSIEFYDFFPETSKMQELKAFFAKFLRINNK